MGVDKSTYGGPLYVHSDTELIIPGPMRLVIIQAKMNGPRGKLGCLERGKRQHIRFYIVGSIQEDVLAK